MPATAIGLLLALGAALSTGVASVLQGLAARNQQRQHLERSVGQLFVSPRYLVGTALDVIGFGCFVVALHWLPLFLVQCASTASVGVTAVLGHYWLRMVLRQWQVATLVGLAAGLLLLAAGARTGAATAVGRSDQWWLMTAAVLIGLVGAGLASGAGPNRRAGGALAAFAGLAFAGTGVASRVLSDATSLRAVASSPASYALLVFGATGMALFAASLQKSAVTTATAALFGIETLAASAVGLLVLGDSTKAGWIAPSAAGFGITLVCALVLALGGDGKDRAGTASHDEPEDRERCQLSDPPHNS